MRIAILCNDTRGGIQPYVALELGLSRAGHEVRAVTPRSFASMFATLGARLREEDGVASAVEHLGRIAEARSIARKELR